MRRNTGMRSLRLLCQTKFTELSYTLDSAGRRVGRVHIVPVDGSDIVSVLVQPNFIEFQPLTFESGMIFTSKGTFHHLTDLDFELAYLPEDIFHIGCLRSVCVLWVKRLWEL